VAATFFSSPFSPQEAETAEALSKRGEAKRRKGDLVGARADFEKAIELNPACAAGYSGRGLVKQFTGDLDEALLD
jgi:Flp pilus assembly protein TadD